MDSSGLRVTWLQLLGPIDAGLVVIGVESVLDVKELVAHKKKRTIPDF